MDVGLKTNNMAYTPFKMKGNPMKRNFGLSPMNKKGPIGDWIKKTKSKIGKWWDPRTDVEKQKDTEDYASKRIAEDVERKDISSLPVSHRKAIEKIMNQ